MEALLRTILPKILGQLSHSIYVHQCKQDLLDRLPQRLAGYAHWIPASWRIVVVVDRDNDDCRELKKRLDRVAVAAKRAFRTLVVNRLAIEELEAWYFGDWTAVRTAYPRVPAKVPGKAGFRNPDTIAGGTWEAFERVLKQSGYFAGGLRKIEAARNISPHMNVAGNTSASFRALHSALAGFIA